MKMRKGSLVVTGAGLCVLYTLLITGADAITKSFATQFAAPQLFAMSGGLVALFCVLAGLPGHSPRQMLHTKCPRAMAVRATATVIGTCAFFYAFRFLPFADVFVFIALIPILAAVMSRLVLHERAGLQSWGAMVLGLVGMLCLFADGWKAVQLGHLIALVAVVMGAVSLVASRFISLRDGGALLTQVFYPNLALMVVMGAALPFVFKPMSWGDVAWVLQYSVLLFAARWVLVGALSLIPAYVVTPLINLQFVWMVAVGVAVFGERPGPEVFAGAALMIAAGCWLVLERVRAERGKVMPAE